MRYIDQAQTYQLNERIESTLQTVQSFEVVIPKIEAKSSTYAKPKRWKYSFLIAICRFIGIRGIIRKSKTDTP